MGIASSAASKVWGLVWAFLWEWGNHAADNHSAGNINLADAVLAMLSATFAERLLSETPIPGKRILRERVCAIADFVLHAFLFVTVTLYRSRCRRAHRDFNDQLTTWLVVANSRTRRSLGCRPADRWAADAAAMLELPPTPPTVGWSTTVRLGRDHYVRLNANDYSVHPSGRRTSALLGGASDDQRSRPRPGRRTAV